MWDVNLKRRQTLQTKIINDDIGNSKENKTTMFSILFPGLLSVADNRDFKYFLFQPVTYRTNFKSMFVLACSIKSLGTRTRQRIDKMRFQ